MHAEPARKLTRKQAAFVEAMLLDPSNPTAAAIKAGYPPSSARIRAHELVRKSNIRTVLEQARAARAVRTQVSADRVVAELAVLGFSSVEHYEVTDDGRLTLAPDAPKHAMRAIASVKHKVRTIPRGPGKSPIIEHDVEYRLWDKNQALTNLGKHTGALVEPEKTGDTVFNIRVVRYGDTLQDSGLERSAEPAPQPRLPLPRHGQPAGEPDASAPGVSYVPARWG